jgi:hypothetical protein
MWRRRFLQCDVLGFHWLIGSAQQSCMVCFVTVIDTKYDPSLGVFPLTASPGCCSELANGALVIDALMRFRQLL